MNITIKQRPSRDGKKTYYQLEWGRGKGERIATGIWTHSKPKTALEKEFNKQQLAILEFKRSDMIVNKNSLHVGYFDPSKLEKNFLVYYQTFIDKNKRPKKRHLESSLAQLKLFLSVELKVAEANSISHTVINEELCKRFRQYLLDKFHGETPMNYFTEFKRVMKAATKDYYFRENPAENVAAKKNPSTPKEILEGDEVLRLFQAPCPNNDVKAAYMFCMYTALAWVDVKKLKWEDIYGNKMKYSRAKNGNPVLVPLHPNAIAILHTLPNDDPKALVFSLPSHTGAKKALNKWVENASINKNITWHSARHYVSVTLQQKGVDAQTVAGILGHTTTKYVQSTYKRYLQSAAIEGINKLD